MSDFQDPCGMTPDEIWDALQAMVTDDAMVHAVMVARFRLGLDREHTALALAYALIQQLRATRAEFDEWVKHTPRPFTINPGPEFLRSLMAQKG